MADFKVLHIINLITFLIVGTALIKFLTLINENSNSAFKKEDIFTIFTMYILKLCANGATEE